MKKIPTRLVVSLAIAVSVLAPISSRAMAARQECSEDAICTRPAKDKTEAPEKGVMEVVFNKPIDQVQKAAVNALTVLGCKLRKQEPTYVEGKRSNKVGVAVGSGGETLKVWLTASSAESTTVKVKTAKSLVGIVGQRNWDDEMIAEMRKELGE